MSAVPQTPSRLDPEPVPRRDVLGLAALWSMATALLFGLGGILRLPRAAVLPTPSRKFKVDLPESLAEGQAFVPPGRSVALFKDAAGVYAISTVCTHLGCIVKANGGAGFDCPCHGSKFGADGSVMRGPAPRALDWLKCSGSGNSIVVDEDTVVKAGTKASV